jgi:hypothetical protein
VSSRRVVALVDDLMDRSRLLAAVPTAEPIRAVSAAAGADVVIVDLARHASAVGDVRRVAPAATILAFGPHVDDELLAAARRDGADVVMARSQFFRDPLGALGDAAPS